VDSKRDSIVKGLGASVVDEKRTSVAGYPGKWIRFIGPNTSGELAIYLVGHRLYLLTLLFQRVFSDHGTFLSF
jgi:hypothetical protein